MFLISFFFLFWPPYIILSSWARDQSSNHSCHLYHRRGNGGFLTHCARLHPSTLEMLLVPLGHSGNSGKSMNFEDYLSQMLFHVKFVPLKSKLKKKKEKKNHRKGKKKQASSLVVFSKFTLPDLNVSLIFYFSQPPKLPWASPCPNISGPGAVSHLPHFTFTSVLSLWLCPWPWILSEGGFSVFPRVLGIMLETKKML